MIATNQQIAQQLRARANELARNGDNLYRVRAFRQAAMAVLALPEELAALLATDRQALDRVPGIGRSLAKTITAYLSESRQDVAA
jgi:DNA polymerase/3'-5' exonuclease PolX